MLLKQHEEELHDWEDWHEDEVSHTHLEFLEGVLEPNPDQEADKYS